MNVMMNQQTIDKLKEMKLLGPSPSEQCSARHDERPICRIPEHAGCEDAQAALTPWTRFEATAARRAADAAARVGPAWSPLTLMLDVLTEE